MRYGMKIVPVAQLDRASAFYGDANQVETTPKRPGLADQVAVARTRKALRNAQVVGGELVARYLEIRGIALCGRWRNREITDGERASIHDALAEIYRNLDQQKRDALALLIAHRGGAATIDEVVSQSADLRDWAKRLVADAMAGAAR